MFDEDSLQALFTKINMLIGIIKWFMISKVEFKL